jgi:hypothetical protein
MMRDGQMQASGIVFKQLFSSVYECIFIPEETSRNFEQLEKELSKMITSNG